MQSPADPRSVPIVLMPIRSRLARGRTVRDVPVVGVFRKAAAHYHRYARGSPLRRPSARNGGRRAPPQAGGSASGKPQGPRSWRTPTIMIELGTKNKGEEIGHGPRDAGGEMQGDV